MIKLIPMPNPFAAAFSSYKMTNIGKALIATTIAEAAINAYENSGYGNQNHNTYSDPVQEAWAFYGTTLQIIKNKPSLTSWWNSISQERKEKSLIEFFCQEGKGHLVPVLQQHIFPTLR